MFIKPYSFCFIALTFFACDTNNLNTGSSESENQSGHLTQLQSKPQVNESEDPSEYFDAVSIRSSSK